MRVVIISDTHTKHHLLDVPEGDLLIHAGDFSMTGQFFEVRDFADWFDKQTQAKYRVVIAGNHELSFDSNQRQYAPHIVDMMRGRNFHYLEDSGIELCGLKIYGTPWTPYFHGWAFNGMREVDLPYERTSGPSLTRVYGRIPEDTQILICHGPPFDCLDRCDDGRGRGSQELRDRIYQLPILQLVVCGHIHESAGIDDIGGVTVVNACSLGRDYKTIQQPIVVDL